MTPIKCSDICLRSKWYPHDIEAAGFISSDLHINGLLGDVMQAYSSYYSMDQALLSTRIHFYNSAFYTFQGEDDDYQEIKVRVGDIIEIALVNNESGFASIKAIFKHNGNDECDYIFIYVAWFEDISRRDELTLCSIFRLQKDTNHTWYRVHPISTVKPTSEISFVHHCNSHCTASDHEPSNYEYLQNNFLFTAI